MNNSEEIKIKTPKTCLSLTVATFLSMPFVTPAQSTSVDQAIDKLIQTVISRATSADFVKRFCSKPNSQIIFTTTYQQGAACQNKTVAAMAEIICRDVQVYVTNQSGCHQKAVAALGGQNPTTVLQDSIKNNDARARELMCTYKNSLPEQLKSIAEQACPKTP